VQVVASYSRPHGLAADCLVLLLAIVSEQHLQLFQRS